MKTRVVPLIIITVVAFCGLSAVAQTFTNIASLPPVYPGSLKWGDFDSDGDLDLLYVGKADSSYAPMTRIFRYDGAATFTPINPGLTDTFNGTGAWGDYDNDGDLDPLISGQTNLASGLMSRIFQNDSGVFFPVGASLQSLYQGTTSWADIDNDGDLDVMITGYTPGNALVSLLYRNNGGGSFTSVATTFPGLTYGCLAWADYDKDGDNDLLMSGSTNGNISGGFTALYRNNGGSFVDANAGFPYLAYSAAAWGDADNDGNIDLLFSGLDAGYGAYTRLYRNLGTGSFANLGSVVPNAGNIGLAWGDCDNDGDLDILYSGYPSGNYATRVYRNNGNLTFTDVGAGMTSGGGVPAVVAWGDYDSDGDLDAVVSGQGNTTSFNNIYRNESVVSNTPPTAPANLSVSVNGTTATFSWSAASDAQTPVAGLTYNLRVGTNSGGSKIISAMSAADGYHRIPQMGNAQHRLSMTISNLTVGATYYWSVQAIDTAFAGSVFATEQSFVALTRPVVTSITKTNSNFLLKFTGAPSTAYTIQASTNLPAFFNLTNLTADGTGAFELIAPAAATYRFYRAAYP